MVRTKIKETMIIVKTNTGTHFVTDKETHIVQHEKENKMVSIRSPKEGLNCNINNVTDEDKDLLTRRCDDNFEKRE